MIIQDESGKEVIYKTEAEPPPPRDYSVLRRKPDDAPALGKPAECKAGVCLGRLKKGTQDQHEIDHPDDALYTVCVFQPGDPKAHDSKSPVKDTDTVQIIWKNGKFQCR